MSAFVDFEAMRLTPKAQAVWRKQTPEQKRADIVEWRRMYRATIRQTTEHFGVSHSYVCAAWREANEESELLELWQKVTAIR